MENGQKSGYQDIPGLLKIIHGFQEQETSYPKGTWNSSFLSSDDILNHKWPDLDWTVPGFLPIGLVLLCSPQGVSKTWLALQFALTQPPRGAYFPNL